MGRDVSAGRIAAFCLLLGLAGIAPAQEPAPSSCELHFWPTADAMASSNIFLNPALQRGVTTGNVLLDHLPAQAQVSALERLDLASLLRMPGVRVILATAPVSDGVAARQRSRLTASNAPCYAELVVKRMGYRTDMFFGRDFGAVFIYRRFPPGGTTPEIVQGTGEAPLRLFPPSEESQRAAAREEMVAAFGTTFTAFVQAKLNRPSRR